MKFYRQFDLFQIVVGLISIPAGICTILGYTNTFDTQSNLLYFYTVVFLTSTTIFSSIGMLKFFSLYRSNIKMICKATHFFAHVNRDTYTMLKRMKDVDILSKRDSLQIEEMDKITGQAVMSCLNKLSETLSKIRDQRNVYSYLLVFKFNKKKGKDYLNGSKVAIVRQKPQLIVTYLSTNAPKNISESEGCCFNIVDLNEYLAFMVEDKEYGLIEDFKEYFDDCGKKWNLSYNEVTKNRSKKYLEDVKSKVFVPIRSTESIEENVIKFKQHPEKKINVVHDWIGFLVVASNERNTFREKEKDVYINLISSCSDGLYKILERISTYRENKENLIDFHDILTDHGMLPEN